MEKNRAGANAPARIFLYCLTSQTDARGNTVTYAYGNNISKMTGQPTAVTDPTNVTRTSSYNTANGRITGTEITGTASLDYIYGSGRLTTMTRSGYVPGDTAEQPQTYTMSYDGFGNMTGVSVGNKSLASYTYSGNNGQLSQMSYGNGDSVSYSYDNLERVQNVYYNGSSSPALTYSYKGEGTLGSLTDSVNNRTYSYTYDSLGRLSAMTEKSGSTSVQTYNASYDTANRLTGYNYQLSPAWNGTLGSTRTYGYTYKASDGSLSSMTAPGGSFAYAYDGLKRLSSRVLTVGGATLINRQFGYLAGAGTNGTTLLVSSLTNKNASGGTISQYNYTYDALGNITAISGSTSASYTYDNQGQLLTETVGDTTWTYAYDTYGNLRSKTDGTNTDTYTYGDSQWLDLLTAYNGNAISYDAIGNPTTWYDGTTFTWVNGRRLASATNTAENLTATYTYDSDGLRLTKTINGVEHKYLWQGSKLVSEYYDGKELEFFYDESGNPYAFSYKASSSATPVMYYYLTNLQGDITGILDASGTTVAAYTYNAWGKLLSSSGDKASINPLRYRGYYYDAELGMYYVSSRYYAPEICRFINADSYVSTGQGFLGCNAFSYCLNNPVLYKDFDGYIAGIDDAAIAGGIMVCGFLLLASYYLTTPAGQQSIHGFVSFAYDVYSDICDLITPAPSNVSEAKKSNTKSSGNAQVDTGGGTASPPAPGNNKNNNRENGNWKNVNEKYLESQLRKQGTDPHSIKYEYLGSRAKVSRYDLYVDKATGRLAIFEKSTGRLVEITNYFIK